MPTQPYILADGSRAPGVTTVLKNLGWSTENLIRWANRQGLAGNDIRGPGAQMAANVGTLIHALVEAKIKGKPQPDVPAAMEVQALQGLATFDQWLKQTRIEVVETEVPLVNEEFRTGGCLDAIGREADGLSILDWKTGGGPYPEQFIQVATYNHLYELERGVRTIGAHVCRFGKDTGIFHQVFFPRDVLDVGWTAFTWARALHEIRPRIERYVR